MKPRDLHAWRRRCDFPSWAEAAAALGRSERQIYRYLQSDKHLPHWLEALCDKIEKERE